MSIDKRDFAAWTSALETLKRDGQSERWRRDPAAWVSERLGEHVWSKQAEILTSVAKNKLTAVQASHSVGKSFLVSRLVGYYIDNYPPGDFFVVTCFTDDTEILTLDGWKRFQDVKSGPDGDWFATRNQYSKAFEWQQATRYYKASWDGEVVDVKSRSVDMRVTPNHRMLVKWRDYAKGTSGEILKPAEKITRRGAEVPVTSEWQAPPVLPVQFGRYEWDSVTFASFLGAWLAEGSLGPPRKYVRKSDRKTREGSNDPSGAITITQLPGTKGYEPFRELLTKMLGREPCRNMGKDWVFHCSDLWHYLSELGTAKTKFIPTLVKNWGRPELEALLHHYLLGDGWSQRTSIGNESWRAVTVSKRLADDLQEIAQKVGLSASIKVRQPRDGGTFADGRRILAKNCSLGYYLCFNTSECRSVSVSRSHYQGNVYCVSVPNEVIYVRRNGSAIWCGNTAPTWAQVRAIIWRYIAQMAAKHDLPGYVTQNAEWKIGNELVAFGRKPADQNQQGLQGLHANRGVIAVIDEASGVQDQIWNAVDSLTTTPESRTVAVGNPDAVSSRFFRACTTEPGWNRIKISSFDTPAFTGEEVPDAMRSGLVSREWVADKAVRWGTNSALYKIKVMGEFAEVDDFAVIPLAWVRLAQQRWLDYQDLSAEDKQLHGPTGRTILGVDVGHMGEDKSVIVTRRGHVVSQIESWAKKDTVAVAGLVKQRLFGGQSVAVVDAIGVGAGVVDQLRNGGQKVVPFSSSATTRRRDSTGTQGMTNLRASAWWNLRELLDPAMGAKLCLPPDDDLASDLSTPRFETVAGNRIKIESKDDIRKRLGRSTDLGDALVYSYFVEQFEREYPDGRVGLKRTPIPYAHTGGSWVR